MLKRWAFASATALSRLCFAAGGALYVLGGFFTDCAERIWSGETFAEIRARRKEEGADV